MVACEWLRRHDDPVQVRLHQFAQHVATSISKPNNFWHLLCENMLGKILLNDRGEN